MFLNDFFTDRAGLILVSRQQASDFAKKVAGDFNPIHDADSKRFCVPGDLLFSLVLNKYGLSQKMDFTFAGMVGDTPLLFPETDSNTLDICDESAKKYLTIERSGDISRKQELIDNLTRAYVAFSGQTFPHILVPLMAKHHVMINPERPLVIYERMSIEIARFDVANPKLELTNSTLSVDGKRGNACLSFSLTNNGEIVGKGEKAMVLSGLREFDQTKIDELVANYSKRKDSYGL
ncbi:MAG: DUF3581 domain-containing protein [Gammaproteobacteria bacterium]|nr:DUF3581 domain-containing protein [Gammaproteobacteria bacterium]